MTSQESKIVTGPGGETWNISYHKVAIKGEDGKVTYRDIQKMDLLAPPREKHLDQSQHQDFEGAFLPLTQKFGSPPYSTNNVFLPIDRKDKNISVFELKEKDGKISLSDKLDTSLPLSGSFIPETKTLTDELDVKMTETADETPTRPPPISYGALNDTWKSTGVRTKHYDPMPEIPYDTDLTGNRQAQEWAFNVLPLGAEQKDQFLQTLVRDQARIDNLKVRQRVLPIKPSKRKIDNILDGEITKENPKGRTSVKTISSS